MGDLRYRIATYRDTHAGTPELETLLLDLDAACAAKDARIADLEAENLALRSRIVTGDNAMEYAKTARAEIEALRKQLEEAWESRDQYLRSNVKLKDEILALRKRVGLLEAERDQARARHVGTTIRAEQAEAQLAVSSEADIPRFRVCPTCGGRGLTSHPDAAEQEDCEHCGGAGEIIEAASPTAPPEAPAAPTGTSRDGSPIQSHPAVELPHKRPSRA